MKWKNKRQASERMKHILDGYIKGYELLKRKFSIDWEDDSDIAEWDEEELENGDGYVSVGDIDLLSSRQIHLSDVAYVSNLLEQPVYLEEWTGDYKYQISVMYKGYKFFDLYTLEEYRKMKEWFYKEVIL